MKNTFYLFIFLLIPFYLSCKNIQAQRLSPNITLIFDNIPVLERSINPFPQIDYTSAIPQITIFDNFYQKAYNPRAKEKDTLIFSPKEEYIVVSFLYSILHAPLEFLISKGDTITFKYINNLPYATSVNNNMNGNLNYEYNRFIANTKANKYTSYEVFLNPIIIAKSINDIVNNEREIKKSWYEAAQSFLINELSVLSKQTEMKEKIPIMFKFFYDKLTYQINKIDFEQRKLSVTSLDSILYINKIKPMTSLPYSYFLPFLESVTEEKIVNKSKVLKSTNMTIVDYREVYDKISSWDVINNFYKKYLLYKYLKKIGESFSSSDLQIYTNKFFYFTKDTTLTNNIKNEFMISDGATSSTKDSLYMFNFNNDKLSFEKFLKLNKGKVIYIDFWASWCAPCRREMKNAEKLREDFRNKDIVFACFSIDKNKNEWIEACNVERLDKLQSNYILVNIDSSNFLKSIKFSSIPRYLLYNKSGQLVHKNAPGPGSEEIVNLLTKYLSDKTLINK